MGASLTPLIFSRLAGVLAALWLCGAGSAWAGDGGDLASLQAIIGQPDGSTGLGVIFGMKPCPQLPTVTQGIWKWPVWGTPRLRSLARKTVSRRGAMLSRVTRPQFLLAA